MGGLLIFGVVFLVTARPDTLERMKEAKKHAFRKKWNVAFRELLGLTAALQEETGKKILLILDEFQDLAGLELPDPFGLFGKEMMIQKNTFYLAAGSESRESLEIFHQRLSLLFGNFEIVSLGPLKQEAVRQWAVEKCRTAPIPETELRVLSHLLDNHPYYFSLFFQEAGRQLRQDEGRAWDRDVSLQVLEGLLLSKTGPYHLFFESRLQGLVRFGRFTRPYLKTLMALALGRFKPLAIAAYTNRKISEVQKILSRLVDEGMVERQGPLYRLPDPLFRIWLRKVYYLEERNLEPDGRRVLELFRFRLRQELERIENEDRMDLTERVSALFREFRNESVVVGPLKIKCPTILEIAARPTNGRYFPIQARTRQGRWFCQVAREPVTEADVTQFVEDLKLSRQKIQSRILVALGGIELNARLLAQEARIQIWDLESFNALLNLFGKLKVIVS